MTNTYGYHVLAMIEERRLKLEWVVRAIDNPDWTEPDPNHPDRTRAFKALPERDMRIVRVVYTPEGDALRVITAFLDRGATKKR